MSIARVWGKALSAADVEELCNQAKSTSHDITIDATGYAALCLPFAAVVPTGMKAYAAVRKDASAVTLALLADGGEAVAYGTPFILKGTPGDYTIQAADLSAVKVHSSSGNIMQGSFIAKDIDAYEFRHNGSAVTLTHSGTIGLPATCACLPYVQGEPATLSIILSDSVIPLPEDNVNKADTVTGNNISGHITCNGCGVQGVKVSDGFTVTTTDKDGFYTFRSDKKNGYVFYSIPSGYMPQLEDNATSDDKIFVPFWHAVRSPSPYTAEVHDFKLRVENNEEFYFLAGADSHQIGRASCRERV